MDPDANSYNKSIKFFKKKKITCKKGDEEDGPNEGEKYNSSNNASITFVTNGYITKKSSSPFGPFKNTAKLHKDLFIETNFEFERLDTYLEILKENFKSSGRIGKALKKEKQKNNF